jgi:hypothetical protein
LGECDVIAVGNAGFDAVRHGAAADIVEVGGDFRPALQLQRLAWRVLAIDDLQYGIIVVEAG